MPVNYNPLFDEHPHPCWLIAPETHIILRANGAAVAKYGYSLEEFTGMNVMSLRPEEDAAAFAEGVKAIPQDGSGGRYEKVWRHRKRNGEVFHARISSIPLTYEDGIVWLATAIDIDEEIKLIEQNRELNQTVQQQKERLLQIATSVPEVLWIARVSDFRMLYVSEAATKVYGYTPEELTEVSVGSGLIFQPQKNSLQEAMMQILQHGHASFEWDAQHKDGSHKIIQHHCTLQRDENGKPATVTGISIDVTESKTLQKRIKTDALRVQAMINNTADCIWLVDHNLTLLAFNKPYQYYVENYFGVKIAIGDSALSSQRLTPSDTSRRQRYERALSGESFSAVEEVQVDAMTYYVEYTFLPVKDETTGAITAISCTARDITQQLTHQKVIEEEARKTGEILESITDAFCALDAEGRFTYVNTRYEELYKVRREDLLGKTMWECFPNTVESFKKAATMAMREQKTVEVEFYSRTPGRWINGRIYPAREGLSFYFKDITEEMQLREKIRTEEANLHALTHNTDDMIWLIDKDFNLLAYNKRYEESHLLITGHYPEKGKSISWGRYLGDEDPITAEWMGHYHHALKGIPFKTVQEGKGPEGTIYFEVSFFPIHTAGGELTGISCNCRDITEQRHQILRIQQQNEQLKSIAWTQSHLVRGPLASILGLLNLYNRDVADDPENLELIDMIITAASELDAVVHDVVGATYGGSAKRP